MAPPSGVVRNLDPVTLVPSVDTNCLSPPIAVWEGRSDGGDNSLADGMLSLSISSPPDAPSQVPTMRKTQSFRGLSVKSVRTRGNSRQGRSPRATVEQGRMRGASTMGRSPRAAQVQPPNSPAYDPFSELDWDAVWRGEDGRAKEKEEGKGRTFLTLVDAAREFQKILDTTREKVELNAVQRDDYDSLVNGLTRRLAFQLPCWRQRVKKKKAPGAPELKLQYREYRRLALGLRKRRRTDKLRSGMVVALRQCGFLTGKGLAGEAAGPGHGGGVYLQHLQRSRSSRGIASAAAASGSPTLLTPKAALLSPPEGSPDSPKRSSQPLGLAAAPVRSPASAESSDESDELRQPPVGKIDAVHHGHGVVTIRWLDGSTEDFAAKDVASAVRVEPDAPQKVPKLRTQDKEKAAIRSTLLEHVASQLAARERRREAQLNAEEEWKRRQYNAAHRAFQGLAALAKPKKVHGLNEYGTPTCPVCHARTILCGPPGVPGWESGCNIASPGTFAKQINDLSREAVNRKRREVPEVTPPVRPPSPTSKECILIERLSQPLRRAERTGSVSSSHSQMCLLPVAAEWRKETEPTSGLFSSEAEGAVPDAVSMLEPSSVQFQSGLTSRSLSWRTLSGIPQCESLGQDSMIVDDRAQRVARRHAYKAPKLMSPETRRQRILARAAIVVVAGLTVVVLSAPDHSASATKESPKRIRRRRKNRAKKKVEEEAEPSPLSEHDESPSEDGGRSPDREQSRAVDGPGEQLHSPPEGSPLSTTLNSDGRPALSVLSVLSATDKVEDGSMVEISGFGASPLTREQLTTVLAPFGDVLDVRLGSTVNPRTGKSLKRAWAYFDEVSSAKACVEKLSGRELKFDGIRSPVTLQVQFISEGVPLWMQIQRCENCIVAIATAGAAAAEEAGRVVFQYRCTEESLAAAALLSVAVAGYGEYARHQAESAERRRKRAKPKDRPETPVDRSLQRMQGRKPKPPREHLRSPPQPPAPQSPHRKAMGYGKRVLEHFRGLLDGDDRYSPRPPVQPVMPPLSRPRPRPLLSKGPRPACSGPADAVLEAIGARAERQSHTEIYIAAAVFAVVAVARALVAEAPAKSQRPHGRGEQLRTAIVASPPNRNESGGGSFPSWHRRPPPPGAPPPPRCKTRRAVMDAAVLLPPDLATPQRRKADKGESTVSLPPADVSRRPATVSTGSGSAPVKSTEDARPVTCQAARTKLLLSSPSGACLSELRDVRFAVTLRAQ